MADQYFIRGGDGRAQGPFSIPSIQAYIVSGKVRPEMDFSEDGVNWVSGHSLPELFGEAPAEEEVEVIGEDAAPQVTAPVRGGLKRSRWAGSGVAAPRQADGTGSDLGPVSSGRGRYKFVVVYSKCTEEYSITDCEETANQMARRGMELVQVYQTTTRTCWGQSRHALVMVFHKAA